MHEIYDPAVYADGIPYPAYAHLREHDPVSWQAEPDLPGLPAGPGFWAVTRYDDVQHVSKSADVFSASLGGTQLRDPNPADLPFLRAMLLNMDPPTHNTLRRTISHLFTPRAVGGLEPMIEQTTGRLMRAARERGDFDLVEDVTDELSLTTLAQVLGVPESDKQLFFGWANRIIGYQDDEYGDTTGADPRSPDALHDMHEYAQTLRDFRLRHPGPDVISALTHARIDGEPLSDEAFKNFFFLFAVAGNDTTRSALPGGILALLEHPEQLELLRRRPELLAPAVEECLRFAPPVVLFRRTATRDTHLRGRRIRAGEKVVVLYPAANRDPEEFADPDRFDITRTPNRHVSFGHGPHVCVAAALARMQLRSMFSAVVSQLPGLTVRGPVERLKSHLVAGIKRIPVALPADAPAGTAAARHRPPTAEETPVPETTAHTPDADAALNEVIDTIIEEAGLRRPRNTFFRNAKEADAVTPESALAVAVQWQEITKAFMFTTLASVGVRALECHRHPSPGREELGALQTAYAVIGDDFINVAPEFSAVAPRGAAGIHYVWWADTVVEPLASLLGADAVAEAVDLPAGVRGLLDTMDRLASSPLGAAVQLRLVEAIALDIAVAFRRLYGKLRVQGETPFAATGALDWVDAHIRAETAHAKSVSDTETGMTALATSPQERAELVRLLSGYAVDWARALDDFAGALAESPARAGALSGAAR